MVGKMIRQIKQWYYHRQIKKLIRQANEMAKLTGYRYMIIWWQGQPRLVRKKELKNLIARHYFRKGTTIQDIERRAIYVTI
jgi:hypothetical protein